MRIWGSWVSGLALLSASAAGVTPARGAEPPSLLEEIASGALPRINLETIHKELATAHLIAIGESHEPGLERQLIGEHYSALATRLPKNPEHCLVENFPVLIESQDSEDPVKPRYFDVCSRRASVNNPHDDYRALLSSKLDFRGNTPLITHTGFRHILPWGLIFPADFPTHALDRSPHGTISLQIPEKFLRKGLRMRSLTPVALDNLLVQMIRDGLKKRVAPRELNERIQKILSNERLQLSANERSREYELSHAESRSAMYPAWHRAFISLVNHGVLKKEQIQLLLGSPELARLLSETIQARIQVGFWRGDRLGRFSIGDRAVESPGYLYIIAPKRGNDSVRLLVESTTDGKLALVEVGPQT